MQRLPKRLSKVFSVTNPNYNNTDKSIFANVQALEIDQLKNYGYKTNKTGLKLVLVLKTEDFRLGLSSRSFVEKIETIQQHQQDKKHKQGIIGTLLLILISIMIKEIKDIKQVMVIDLIIELTYQ